MPKSRSWGDEDGESVNTGKGFLQWGWGDVLGSFQTWMNVLILEGLPAVLEQKTKKLIFLSGLIPYHWTLYFLHVSCK